VQSVTTDAEARLASWLSGTAGIEGVRFGPLLTGGNANVTRLLESNEGRFVLRHPPIHTVSDKAAQGISREFKALQALYGRAPVPRPVAWCDDRAILGQPFAVTEWLDGVAITKELPPAYPQNIESVNLLGQEMMRGLAAVHKVNWQGLLPENFGKPDTFVQRQIDRWMDVRSQYSVRDLPLLGEVATWLRQRMPKARHASIIHCDFHLDNCLVSRTQPKLLAIIDWEMATLGDPLIDLGLCLFFWRRDPEKALGFPWLQSISNRPDAATLTELADLWSNLTDIDHAQLHYYIVFAAWRLAAIVEGAYVLYRQGKDDSAYARGLEHDVPNLLREAAEYIERGRI
jgi:aminoglycoside phosphotransferase (APT) family kinase protein